MMQAIQTEVSDWQDEEAVAAAIHKVMDKQLGDKSGLIYGMGHAVYTLSDPRAVILKEIAGKTAKEKGRYEEFLLYNAVEKIAPQVFSKRRPGVKIISANVDFYSGFVCSLLDIPTDLFTPLFAIARVVGWSAHRIEELATSNKIIRPAYKVKAQEKMYTPIEKRK